MNSFCTGCRGLASKFCLCQGTIYVLCDSCSIQHERLYPHEVHDQNPLAYFPVLQGLGIEGFRMQKMQIATGTALVKRLEDVENQEYMEIRTGVEAAMKKYLEWLDYLHLSFQKLIQQFHREKTVPMSSLQFQLSKFTYWVFGIPDSRPAGDLSMVEKQPFLSFQKEFETMQQRLYRTCGPSNDFEDYYISSCDLAFHPVSQAEQSPSSSQSEYHYIDNPSPPAAAPPQSQYVVRPKSFETYIPFSRGSLLAKWITKTQNLERVKLTRPVKVSKHTVSVVLPNGDLFCCGGRDMTNTQTMVLDGENGTVTVLNDMNEGRANCGIVYTNEMIFVFGGFSTSGSDLRTGEKLQFQNSTWTRLRNPMADARNQFNPAAHQQKIYIAGGYHSTKVECFTIPQESFSTLSLTLSKPFGTICLVYNGELLILQDTTLLQWKIGSPNSQEKRLDLKVIESNVSPQFVGSKVYFNKEADNICEIYVFDLTNMTIKMMEGLKNGPDCPIS